MDDRANNEAGITNDPQGGQGEPTSLLGDLHRVESDCKLIRRAARERWPVAPTVRRAVVSRLASIVRKTEVTVPVKDGAVTVEAPADSNAIAASRVLVAMEGQNQADDHLADKNHRLDNNKPTENVGFVKFINGVPESAL